MALLGPSGCSRRAHGRPATPYGPIGNPGCPIGNPVGLIARWRAAQVRPAPRQSAPGAIVGQVCALGAASGSFSALGASFELLLVRLAPFRAGLALLAPPLGRAGARRQHISFVYKVFLTFNFNQNSFVLKPLLGDGSVPAGPWSVMPPRW